MNKTIRLPALLLLALAGLASVAASHALTRAYAQAPTPTEEPTFTPPPNPGLLPDSTGPEELPANRPGLGGVLVSALLLLCVSGLTVLVLLFARWRMLNAEQLREQQRTRR